MGSWLSSEAVADPQREPLLGQLRGEREDGHGSSASAPPNSSQQTQSPQQSQQQQEIREMVLRQARSSADLEVEVRDLQQRLAAAHESLLAASAANEALTGLTGALEARLEAQISFSQQLSLRLEALESESKSKSSCPAASLDSETLAPLLVRFLTVEASLKSFEKEWMHLYDRQQADDVVLRTSLNSLEERLSSLEALPPSGASSFLSADGPVPSSSFRKGLAARNTDTLKRIRKNPATRISFSLPKPSIPAGDPVIISDESLVEDEDEPPSSTSTSTSSSSSTASSTASSSPAASPSNAKKDAGQTPRLRSWTSRSGKPQFLSARMLAIAAEKEKESQQQEEAPSTEILPSAGAQVMSASDAIPSVAETPETPAEHAPTPENSPVASRKSRFATPVRYQRRFNSIPGIDTPLETPLATPLVTPVETPVAPPFSNSQPASDESVGGSDEPVVQPDQQPTAAGASAAPSEAADEQQPAPTRRRSWGTQPRYQRRFTDIAGVDTPIEDAAPADSEVAAITPEPDASTTSQEQDPSIAPQEASTTTEEGSPSTAGTTTDSTAEIAIDSMPTQEPTAASAASTSSFSGDSVTASESEPSEEQSVDEFSVTPPPEGAGASCSTDSAEGSPSEEILQRARSASSGDKPSPRSEGRSRRGSSSSSSTRSHTLAEILKTEVSFVGKLRFLVESVINPLREVSRSENPWINSTQLVDLFASIPNIYEAHLALQTALKERLTKEFFLLPDSQQLIGDALELIPKTVTPRLYIEYMTNFSRALAALGEVEQLPQWVEFFKQPEVHKGLNSLLLQDLLILPVQQAPRYQMHLTRLQGLTPESHPDYAAIQATVGEMESILCNINMTKGQIEVLEQMMLAKQKLRSSGQKVSALLAVSAKLLKEGVLTVAGSQKPLTFFLFNNVLIESHADPKSDKLITTAAYPTERILSAAALPDVPCGIQVTIQKKGRVLKQLKTVVLSLVASSALEQRRWIDTFATILSEEKPLSARR